MKLQILKIICFGLAMSIPLVLSAQTKFSNSKVEFYKMQALKAKNEKDTLKSEKFISSYIGLIKPPHDRSQIDFIASFVTKVDDPAFQFLQKNKLAVDKLFGEGTTYRTNAYFIERDILNPGLKAGKSWKQLGSEIRQYREIGKESLALFKVGHYLGKKDWKAFIDAASLYLNNYPNALPSQFVNNWMWEACLACENVEVLERASNCMREIVEKEMSGPKPYEVAPFIDTYACLLYKSGRKETAIQWEQKAAEWAVKENNSGAEKSYLELVYRMKKNEEIWK